MARIKLTPPGKILFRTKVPVRITDLNYGNHLGNDALVSILHEARVQWLKSGGFTELNAGGTGLIMADLAVEYKAEGFYGDELAVAIGVDDISKLSFDIYYTITNQQGKLVAQAKTGIVCYDYEKKKVAEMGALLKEFLS
ncbi:MAG: thioesterase family protein [Ferruginibacter sp.]